MPLRPNFVERLLVRTGVLPGMFLDVFMSAASLSALVAAAEIGLFEQLKEGPLDLETLTARTEASSLGVEALLQALVPLGYVKLTGGRYALTRAARRSLPIDEISAMAPFLKTISERCTGDGGLAVRDAPERGAVGSEGMRDGDLGRAYQAVVRWMAPVTVGGVVKKAPMPPGAERMLDVGGGHGLYTVGFCRRHPKLHGTILDWGVALDGARQTLDENPDVAGRIDLVERDFEQDELPGGVDLAYVSNIVHMLSPDGIRSLFGKLSQATTERGTIVLMDQLGAEPGTGLAQGVPGLMGFVLFVMVGGRAYPYEDLRGWLVEAGFSKVSRKELRQPGFSLVIGRKP